MKWLVLPLLLLTGCRVGPDYTPPQFFIDDTWHSDAVLAEPDPLWWEIFGDPLLTHYIELTAANNPTILAAESHILQARALKQVIQAPLFPHINADINGQRTYFSKNGPLFELAPGNGMNNFTPQIPQLQNLFNATFDATWELDLFGKTLRNIQGAEATIGIALEERNDRLVTLTAETARNYIEIRGLQKRAALTEKNIMLLNQIARVAQKRFERGLSNRLDYERVEAERATTQATLPGINAAIYRSIYALSVLTGQPPEALLGEMLSPQPLPPIPTGLTVGLRSDILRRRPDVRRAERELAAATAQVGVAVASFFPTVTLVADIGFQSLMLNTLFHGKSKTWAYGADVNLPIFQGGALVGNFHAAEWGANEAAWLYQQAVLNALQDSESALVAYNQDYQATLLNQESAARTRKVFALSQERYQRGLINLTDLLDSERQNIAAELTLVGSTTTTLVDIIALYKALGGGWVPFTCESL